jgi:hypothetical protein
MKNPLISLVTFSLYAVSQAVIIAGGDGTGNTTAPVGDQGWSYVGRIDNKPSSVTYVGNQWFITANHIKVLDNPGSVLLNGGTYSIMSDSWTRITNSTGTGADLMMFRVSEDVGLNALTISSSSPSSGTSVTMIGNGLNRAPELQTWQTSSHPAKYKEGYYIGSGTTKRWGLNTIEGAYSISDIGYGATDGFYVDFDNALNEAQGATYDSGGGVFVDNGGGWELEGIILGVGNLYTVSGTNAVFFTGGDSAYPGSETYMADLSKYSAQINQVIPEPTPAFLFVGIALVFGVIKRIRYMYQ